jgi:hypothetical protein
VSHVLAESVEFQDELYELTGIRNPLGGFVRVVTPHPVYFYINVTYDITICAFFLCIKSYSVSVTKGRLFSEELSSWYDMDGMYHGGD